MKGYKAFHKGMICNGKQYAENTVFEENGADACCNPGVMHFCETPFDCLNYYPLVDGNGEFSEFAEVEPLEDVLSKGNKRATKKLRIGAKLKFGDFIKAAVNVIVENTRYNDAKGKQIGSSGYGAQIGSSGNSTQIGSSGDCAQIGSSGYGARIGSSGNSTQIGSSGDCAQIGSSGYGAQIGSSGNSTQIGSSGNYARIGSSGNSTRIGSSGDCAQIGSSGYDAQIGSSGYDAQIGSSGDYARIGSSGYDARIGSSGDYARIGSSGDYARIGSSGDYVRIGSSGQDSVVCCAGHNCAVKAKTGSWITLAEWAYDEDKKRYAPVCVKTECVDGERIKADTWYKLKNGEFSMADEEKSTDA